jgi:hypothetical protein
MNNDYYSVLGVASTATAEEIKRRYRFLCQAYHPDKFSSDAHRRIAEEEFKRINEAYEVVYDPAQRARFDSSRSRHSTPAPEPPTRQVPPKYEPPPRSSHESRILILRDNSRSSSWCAYKIVLDGVVVSRVSVGKSVVLQVTPGKHCLQLRIDGILGKIGRATSKEVLFDVPEGTQVDFRCGNASDLSGSGQRPVYVGQRSNFEIDGHYLWLNRTV